MSDKNNNKIRYELFDKPGQDFTFEEYDAMECYDEAYAAITHGYHLKRITHLPEDEPIVKTLKQIIHHDPIALRERATQLYREELKFLEDKYSPRSYRDYDKSKGARYNIVLEFWRYENSGQGVNALTVEGSFEDYQEKMAEQRVEEAAVFKEHGYEYPEEYK